ncbi:unnamed protein product [Adineta steineri]|uniref:EGF domain-specific O-linked N-acetylglucosamine transferase n=1 Tax=Adineta steineri TaxID=433720 RepID=A0A813X3J8_9BILA|nr:unnamed protein product [Adineta steineri]CAF0931730.1 unnamed protein product [Adineta steineri]
MFIKRYYSKLFRRRSRRSILLKLILITFCFGAFIQINYNALYLLSQNTYGNLTLCTNTTRNKTILNCSGDPLKQWCKNEINLCHSSLSIYNKLFFVTHSVILQTKFAQGKRLGGEDIQTVLNQAERDEYFQFNKEFLKLPCDISIPKDLSLANHLSSVLSSITPYRTCMDVHLRINETTIAVNRQDYVNIYHTMTDLYTVYLLCRFFQRDPKSVRILFVDAHPKGNLDIFWSKLFHSYTRLGQLKKYPTIFYQELIWSQPQLNSEIDLQRDRRQAPSFFFDFRDHILKQFNVPFEYKKPIDCNSLQIFLLCRRNYVAHPRNPTGKITRQLQNEKQIINDLTKVFSNNSKINFTYNYYENLTMEEQLKITTQKDIFIGMHGAGLTHVLFLKTNRTLIELTTAQWQSQIHYELWASMNHVHHHFCSSKDGSAASAQTILNCINLKISQMCPSMTVNSLHSNQTIKLTPTVSKNISNSTIHI